MCVVFFCFKWISEVCMWFIDEIYLNLFFLFGVFNKDRSIRLGLLRVFCIVWVYGMCFNELLNGSRGFSVFVRFMLMFCVFLFLLI